MNNIFHDKTILITGGTGSLGKTLVKRILSNEQGEVKKLIIFSRDEAKQHAMRVNFANEKSATDEITYNNFERLLEFRLGDVRNFSDIASAMKGADIVINAAALKQVPSSEYFPEQALKTNCDGAVNIIRAISELSLSVETVVCISTDKACKPVNVMGITKSLQERLFLSANILNKETRFIAVRYGNVFASRGSVIPLFHDQITSGGPVTITVPTMTRFLLTLDQAVDTVYAAINDALPGEIFVPRAPASSVIDLAKALIGDRDIEIKITGIRPGEKLHEIMISDEEAPYARECGSYYGISSMLPELHSFKDNKYPEAIKGEYSSEHSVVGLEETVSLLKKNSLMLEDQIANKNDGELLK
jgi:FlaA1/EpsC-like NDP-sugar epimerase|tara:strand:+ start:2209 stop:3288 length:1080 start_codon:yes stop_codon:yes gene_type:complete